MAGAEGGGAADDAVVDFIVDVADVGGQLEEAELVAALGGVASDFNVADAGERRAWNRRTGLQMRLSGRGPAASVPGTAPGMWDIRSERKGGVDKGVGHRRTAMRRADRDQRLDAT